MKNFEPFKNKVWLSSPTMHGDEIKYITEAYNTNWMSTIGENINETERMIADYIGCNHAVVSASTRNNFNVNLKWVKTCETSFPVSVPLRMAAFSSSDQGNS